MPPTPERCARIISSGLTLLRNQTWIDVKQSRSSRFIDGPPDATPGEDELEQQTPDV